MATRVLLIDDEQDFLDIMGAWLTFKGYDVETAHNGLEGLEKLHESEFDLVLLDLMMPTLNGFEFCRRVRTDDQCRSIPIVILTAVRRDDLQKNPEKIGADAFMEKMADHSELTAVMERVLATKKDESSNDTVH